MDHSAQVVTGGKYNVNIWVARKVGTLGSINVSTNEKTMQIHTEGLFITDWRWNV